MKEEKEKITPFETQENTEFTEPKEQQDNYDTGNETYTVAAEMPVKNTSETIGRNGPIGVNQIHFANEQLLKYISLKQNFDNRVVEEDKWYNLRHEEVIRTLNDTEEYKDVHGVVRKRRKIAPTSARLLNVIISKHADAMDSFPEPYCTEVEQSDRQTAEALTQILPIVYERNNFYDIYDACWWDKLKSGVAVYSQTWDESFGTFGDIRVGRVNVLEVFWDVKCTKVQDSPYFFHVKLMSSEAVEEMWPFLKGKTAPSPYGIKEYQTEDGQTNADKVAVVDCYYKRNGILYYMKYCGDELIYASENDPAYGKGKSYYEHGEYPYEVDTLFPLAGTSLAFGFVSVCKCPQMYLDRLNYDIMQNTDANAKPRGIVNKNAGINIEDLSDLDVPFVESNADASNAFSPIRSTPLPGNILEIVRQKEKEMNETSGNTDFSNGLTGGGVTSFSGIAALQEAANKFSRDMIKHSYESCYKKLYQQAIMLMKQFYDIPRYFRITQPNGGVDGQMFSNNALNAQPVQNTMQFGGYEVDLGITHRLPVFDVTVKAQKQNSWNTAALNELAKELFSNGAFAPDRIDQTEIMLEMMSFDGKDKLLERIREKANTMQTIQELTNRLTLMQAMLDRSNAQNIQQQSSGNGQIDIPQEGVAQNDGVQQSMRKRISAHND